jgi:hypothetical protein
MLDFHKELVYSIVLQSRKTTIELIEVATGLTPEIIKPLLDNLIQEKKVAILPKIKLQGKIVKVFEIKAA